MVRSARAAYETFYAPKLMDDMEILLSKTEAQHLRAAHDSAEDTLAEWSKALAPGVSPRHDLGGRPPSLSSRSVRLPDPQGILPEHHTVAPRREHVFHITHVLRDMMVQEPNQKRKVS